MSTRARAGTATPRNFEEYLPDIRGGAPARAVGRLGSYYPTRIGSKSVLCVKSELHLNQDGVATGAGTATMPVARFIKQLYQEVKPRLVITVGTAGGTLPDAELGDVMITRTAKFKCTKEFRNEPFATKAYTSAATIRRKHLAAARTLMAVHARRAGGARLRAADRVLRLPGTQRARAT